MKSFNINTAKSNVNILMKTNKGALKLPSVLYSEKEARFSSERIGLRRMELSVHSYNKYFQHISSSI